MSLCVYPQINNNCFVNSVFNLLAYGVNDKNWKAFFNSAFFSYVINVLRDKNIIIDFENKAENLTMAIRNAFVHPGETRVNDTSFGSTDMTFFTLVEACGLQNNSVQFITPKQVPDANVEQVFDDRFAIPEYAKIEGKNFIVASSLAPFNFLSNVTAFYCLYNKEQLTIADYETKIVAFPKKIFNIINSNDNIINKLNQKDFAELKNIIGDDLQNYMNFLMPKPKSNYTYRVNSLLIFEGEIKNGRKASGHYYVISRINDDVWIIDPFTYTNKTPFLKITTDKYKNYIDGFNSGKIADVFRYERNITLAGIVLEKV